MSTVGRGWTHCYQRCGKLVVPTLCKSKLQVLNWGWRNIWNVCEIQQYCDFFYQILSGRNINIFCIASGVMFVILSVPGCSPLGCQPTPPPCGATVARSTSPWATVTLSDWLQRQTLWSIASDRCCINPPEGAILKLLKPDTQLEYLASLVFRHDLLLHKHIRLTGKNFAAAVY